MTAEELTKQAREYAARSQFANNQFERRLLEFAWLAGFQAATDKAITIIETVREPCTKS